MKTTIILTACVLFSLALSAQQFQPKLSVKLPNGTKPVQLQWIDIDNDSLLDVVLSDSSHQRLSAFSYSDFLTGQVTKNILLSGPFTNGIFASTDLNKDGAEDLIVNGFSSNGAGVTFAYLNEGNFHLRASSPALTAERATYLNFADLNNDGQKEMLVINDSSAWKLFRNRDQHFTQLINSNAMTVQAISVFDFDGNGFNDVAVSGKNKSNSPFLLVIEYKNNFDTLRIIHVPVSTSGVMASGDLDQDGNFDLVISGKNQAGQWVTQSYLNHDSLFITGSLYPGIQASKIDIADFTSDGKADISFFGKDASGNTDHRIITFTGQTIIIPSASVLIEAVGDYDRDGDLDIIQVNDTLGLVLLENTEAVTNIGANVPHQLGDALIYDRLFAYWDRALDDHTPAKTVTYDFLVYSSTEEYNEADFNADRPRRKIVTNGNQGTHNFALLKAPSVVDFVAVQSVDNSFATQSCLKNSSEQPCANTYRTISVCDTSRISIQSPEPASWFSFSDGYLGEHSTLDLTHTAAADTVFSFVAPAANECPTITIYTILISPSDTLRRSASFIVCKDQNVLLTVDAEWGSLQWTKDRQTIGSDNPFSFLPTANSVVIGTAKNSHGCVLKQQDSVTIDLPVLVLEPSAYTVQKGSSVQFHASGGVSYVWSPALSLSDPLSPNPIATPSAETIYSVLMTDSIGCHATGSIDVEVLESAFIPALFSPNGDNSNDELKVYGLNSVQAFHLVIVNREGATVYETADAARVVSEGWNGNHNGSLQPAGIYYWKVEGSTADGKALHLNGKRQGAVVLIR